MQVETHLCQCIGIAFKSTACLSGRLTHSRGADVLVSKRSLCHGPNSEAMHANFSETRGRPAEKGFDRGLRSARTVERHRGALE